jgi:hypothetical protein
VCSLQTAWLGCAILFPHIVKNDFGLYSQSQALIQRSPFYGPPTLGSNVFGPGHPGPGVHGAIAIDDNARVSTYIILVQSVAPEAARLY